MNLKHHLLVHITAVALFCLLVTSTFVLFQTAQQSRQQSLKILTSVSKQLEVQLLHIDTGFGRSNPFPDFSLWKETHPISGVCIRFNSADKAHTQSICRGAEWQDKQWPKLFETVYRAIFTPGHEVFTQIIYKNQLHGSIHVIPSPEMELSQAWESLLALLELSIMTIAGIYLLVYFSINRALRPAQVIISGLEKMQQGDLTVRLPNFELLEWQRTGSAINKLAISQQQLLSDRKKLTFKLITLQDEERRYLARELHDEFGQCLAAVNALSASITHSAKQDNCSDIIGDATSLSRINNHMMTTVGSLLTKLRSVDIDELGLALSLKGLISEWNALTKNKIHFQLSINGDCQQLSEAHTTTLFRIIQECLSNIAKHSSAKNAMVTLNIKADLIVLTINDDGYIDTLPFNNSGLGLLGIHERISALKGHCQLNKNESNGLSIEVTLPLYIEEDDQ